MREWIIGRNPVYEVLQARRRQVFRLIIASGVEEKGRLSDILTQVSKRHIPLERVPRQKLDELGEGHQGVAVEVNGYSYSDISKILEKTTHSDHAPLVLLLDMLQNPQNLGTLLRTAEAAGVDGVIIPLRRSAEVTPAVVHASAGATEHLRLAQMNLAQAMETLKKEGFWIVGLDGGPGSKPIEYAPLDVPLALVVGNEGEGMRQLIRQKCDLLVRLPMNGQIESLNAAVAGSIALYLTLQARNKK